jgi:cysteine desulfurase
MENVYLDNAATTAIRPEVIAEMVRVMSDVFGNPSSTHGFGRQARNIVEMSRKSIARLLGCSASEIVFTSGGTEADNWILRSCVRDHGIRRIVTSRIEHHAVLHTVEALAGEGIGVEFVRVLPSGNHDLDHLATLLEAPVPTLVSLMHVNNEIGTVADLEAIGALCRKHGALFHSDTVQSVGKTPLDLHRLPVDFIAASAHKFHGPKGIGFAYIRKGIGLEPMIVGGEQEKGLRAGTEAVHNIAGMAMALEISMENTEIESAYISNLKRYCQEKLRQNFPQVRFNGENTFYNILNVCVPVAPEKAPMMLFALDMKGIAVSRGSACQSGSAKPSHVLAEILDAADLAKPSLRLSFSHQNTTADIDRLIEALLSA